MAEKQELRQSRASTHFKFFAERYLWGSTKHELEPDERSVWLDFLCMATMNFGEVEIFSREYLAQQLLIPSELLDRSIEKFQKFGKVKRKYKKREKKEIFSLSNWDNYQADYLKKRIEKSSTYKEKKRNDKSAISDTENQPTLHNTTLHKTTLHNTTLNNTTAIDSKSFSLSESESLTAGDDQIVAECLSILRECPDYPLCEYEDKNYILWAIDEYPDIDHPDVLRQFNEFLRENPGSISHYEHLKEAISEWFHNDQNRILKTRPK